MMATKNSYCVLGNAMNAGAMRHGEDISPFNSAIAVVAFLSFATFIFF
tara:strand:- start:1361 stop:1504 length:144 start_codon:yes stop_codon:yes gene_type:complete